MSVALQLKLTTHCLLSALPDSYTESIRALSVAFTAMLRRCLSYVIHLISHTQMFFIPAARNAIKSTSIEQLEISPNTNQALVTFKGGNQYLYSNIEEDALFDVIFYNVKSFGKWVNDNCKNASGVSCFPIAA